MFNNYNSAPLGGWTVPRPVFKRLEVIPPEDVADPLLSLDLVRAHLRYPNVKDNDYLTQIVIPTAIDAVEQYISRSLLSKNLRMWMDFIPGMGGNSFGGSDISLSPVAFSSGNTFQWFELMNAPVTDVASIKFISESDTEQTFDSANYIADFTDQDAPARIILKRGCVWPTDLQIGHALSVEYTAGYGVSADVPASLKHAVLLLIAALYSNRGDAADAQDAVLHFPGVTALLNPYRIMKIGIL